MTIIRWLSSLGRFLFALFPVCLKLWFRLLYISQKGDSGGPLIMKGSDESGAADVLAGIVSWGLGCADASFPGGTSSCGPDRFLSLLCSTLYHC